MSRSSRGIYECVSKNWRPFVFDTAVAGCTLCFGAESLNENRFLSLDNASTKLKAW